MRFLLTAPRSIARVEPIIATAIITSSSVNPVRQPAALSRRPDFVDNRLFVLEYSLITPEKLYILVIYPRSARIGFCLKCVIVLIVGCEMNNSGLYKARGQKQYEFL